jgi:hypothetical protein
VIFIRLSFGLPGVYTTPSRRIRGDQQEATAVRMIGTTPDVGTNTLIVTHKPNILDAPGRDWFEVKEGEASIFRPDGRGRDARPPRQVT